MRSAGGWAWLLAFVGFAHCQIYTKPASQFKSCTDACATKNAKCNSNPDVRADSIPTIQAMALQVKYNGEGLNCVADYTNIDQAGEYPLYSPFYNGGECVFAAARSWCDVKAKENTRQRLCPCTCGAGTFPQNSECASCPAGENSGDDWASCCSDMGEYSVNAGASCEKCSSGQYQTNGAATSCRLCQVGQYQNATNATSCDKCNINQYSDTMGASTCKACPASKLSNVIGSETRFDCLPCPLGSLCKINIQGCESCTPGTFSNDYTDVKCTLCAAGTISDSGAVTCRECLPGFFEENNRTECNLCPPGTVCLKGLLSVDDGYFTWENPVSSKTLFTPCPFKERCVADGMSTICTEGYAGALCLFCNNETHAFHAGGCRLCDPDAFLGEEYISELLDKVVQASGAILILVVLAVCLRPGFSKAERIEEAHFEVARLRKEAMLERLRSGPCMTLKPPADGNTDDTSQSGKKLKWKLKDNFVFHESLPVYLLRQVDLESFKILFMFVQVDIVLSTCLSVPWPDSVNTTYQTLSILLGDVMEFLSAGCIVKSTILLRVEATLIVPCYVCGMCFTGWIFSRCLIYVLKKDDRKHVLVGAFCRMALATVYFFYILVLYRSALTFDCLDINIPPEPKLYLMPENEMECGPSWSGHATRAAIILVIYGCGLPFVIIRALHHYRAVLRTQFYIDVKTPGYATPCVNDDVVCFFVKNRCEAALDHTPTVIKSKSGRSSRWLKFVPPKGEREYVWVLFTDHNGDSPTLIENKDPWVDALFAWLYAGFLPQYLRWEVFNFAWKCVMCVAVPLIFPKSVTQIIVAMLITVLHVLAIGTFEPYANRANTNLSLLLHTSMVFKLGFMAALRTHSGPEFENMSTALALGPVLCVLAAGVFICSCKLAMRTCSVFTRLVRQAGCCAHKKVAQEYYAGTDSDEDADASPFG